MRPSSTSRPTASQRTRRKSSDASSRVRARIRLHADEAGELADLREVVELPPQALLVVVEPPGRSPLHERADPGPCEGTCHRGEEHVVCGVRVVEDGARQGLDALELTEESREPGAWR